MSSESLLGGCCVEVDDEFRCHDYESNRVEKPHRNLPMLGSRVRAYVAEPAPPCLVAHWKRRLGVAAPRYADLGDSAPHVCLFPLQDLRRDLHAVDPDQHYHVCSKAFIAEVDCPQAAVLTQLKTPAVLKVTAAVLMRLLQLRFERDSSTIQHPTRSYGLSSNNEHVNSFALLESQL